MFMVFDLLLGGDLRYHLTQEGRCAEDRLDAGRAYRPRAHTCKSEE
jgi:hypothetical protein